MRPSNQDRHVRESVGPRKELEDVISSCFLKMSIILVNKHVAANIRRLLVYGWHTCTKEMKEMMKTGFGVVAAAVVAFDGEYTFF
ncbi:hypothetical protein CDAR_69581 [Caerostris darwini]|uniref:Uncharacterized protein n=1 Tax=Caerostris darwini TaxID=1538125 RepID=A0AAV4U0S8_9ARAC|nr:hypothetical protein CDAR_69581 [Caerostris darwini]